MKDLKELKNNKHKISDPYVNEKPITADNFFDRVSIWVKNMKVFNS